MVPCSIRSCPSLVVWNVVVDMPALLSRMCSCGTSLLTLSQKRFTEL
jgi:hypothetical protein